MEQAREYHIERFAAHAANHKEKSDLVLSELVEVTASVESHIHLFTSEGEYTEAHMKQNREPALHVKEMHCYYAEKKEGRYNWRIVFIFGYLLEYLQNTSLDLEFSVSATPKKRKFDGKSPAHSKKFFSFVRGGEKIDEQQMKIVSLLSPMPFF